MLGHPMNKLDITTVLLLIPVTPDDRMWSRDNRDMVLRGVTLGGDMVTSTHSCPLVRYHNAQSVYGHLHFIF